MRTLWPQLRPWLDSGLPFALATVVAVDGSAPRRPGAVMAIDPSIPRFLGSVSSGCLDHEVIEVSAAVLAEGGVRHVHFGPDGRPPWSDGLTCGGRVSVRIERWWGIHGGAAGEALAAGVQSWLEEDVAGVVLSDDERHLGITAQGTIGEVDGWPPELVAVARAKLFAEAPSGLVEHAAGSVFLRSIRRRPRLLLIGAVEVGARLIDLAASLGWKTLVIDPRAAYLASERFHRPPETIFPRWPEAVIPNLDLGRRDAALVLTHDPKIDDPALVALLSTRVGYLGAMGSRRSHADRLARLRAQRIGEVELARIHGPAGIPLGAADAAGIATGMLAGLVQWQAGLDAGEPPVPARRTGRRAMHHG